jgi:hypothetical protein
LDISVDRIIHAPKRKCPSGQKMDTFGTCKSVWNTWRIYAGNLQLTGHVECTLFEIHEWLNV